MSIGIHTSDDGFQYDGSWNSNWEKQNKSFKSYFDNLWDEYCKVTPINTGSFKECLARRLYDNDVLVKE